MGAEAPANKSTSRRQGGNGSKPGDGHEKEACKIPKWAEGGSDGGTEGPVTGMQAGVGAGKDEEVQPLCTGPEW